MASRHRYNKINKLTKILPVDYVFNDPGNGLLFIRH